MPRPSRVWSAPCFEVRVAEPRQSTWIEDKQPLGAKWAVQTPQVRSLVGRGTGPENESVLA